MPQKKIVYIYLPNTGWHHSSIHQWASRLVFSDACRRSDWLEESIGRARAIHDAGGTAAEMAGELQRLDRYEEDFCLRWIFASDRPIDHARNKAITTVLSAEEHATHLLMVDADNAPTRSPLDFVDQDLDIVGLPTPIYDARRIDVGGYPLIWNAVRYSPRGSEPVAGGRDGWHEAGDKRGLQEVDAVGSGCILISRRVLESVRPAFVRRYDDETGVASHGSDFEFCRRAKAVGWRVFTHWGYPCSHVKEVDLLQLHRFFSARDITTSNQPQINTAAYWDGRWAARKKAPKYPFYDWIVDQTSPESVLDYGCGGGELLARLANGSGADISRVAVEQCRARGLRAEVVEPSQLPNDRWDTIVASEVLEHVDDDVGLMDAFFERADRVVVTVPNNCLGPGLEPEHRRIYTPRSLESLAGERRVKLQEFGQYLLADIRR